MTELHFSVTKMALGLVLANLLIVRQKICFPVLHYCKVRNILEIFFFKVTDTLLLISSISSAVGNTYFRSGLIWGPVQMRIYSENAIKDSKIIFFLQKKIIPYFMIESFYQKFLVSMYKL